MATRIRLQRHGRKGHPFFHIVVADQRVKRDGRIIERLGSYNPNTNPATIELNFDKAVDWIVKGASPSDTAKAILKYKGVMMKKHLLDGVRKGAFDEAEAENRFDSWLAEKEQRITGKKEKLTQAQQEIRDKALEAERAKNKAREEALAAANAPEPAEEEVVQPAAEEEASPEKAKPQSVEEAANADTPATEEKAPEAKKAADDSKKD